MRERMATPQGEVNCHMFNLAGVKVNRNGCKRKCLLRLIALSAVPQ